jgi:hypothetical protein
MKVELNNTGLGQNKNIFGGKMAHLLGKLALAKKH